MAPEAPGNLVVIDLRFQDGELRGISERVEYDPAIMQRIEEAGGWFGVLWNEAPTHDYAPIGGGVVYIRNDLPPGYKRTPGSTIELDSLGDGRYAYRYPALGEGLMFVLILPEGYTLSDSRPMPRSAKAFEKKRLAVYWKPEGKYGADVEVIWQLRPFAGNLSAERDRINDGIYRAKNVPDNVGVIVDEPPKIEPAESPAALEKRRILFLAANPEETDRLDLEEELRSLEGELRSVTYHEQLELIAAPAVRPDDLVRLLRRKVPSVVHFSGHGSTTGIALRSDQGQELEVSADALAKLFQGRGIKLVVLNACYSDVLAASLMDAVPAVVGTAAEVDDEAARRFSTAFYRTLGDGHSVGEAFRDGRDAVYVHGLEDVFRMRGDQDLILFGSNAAARKPASRADRSARARRTATRASVTITVVRDASRQADAVVVEDDTHLILSAKAEARETHGSPRSFVRHLDDTFPKKPGSVIIASDKGRTQFHAVVHDLDLDPTWNEAWIAEALHKILREAHDRDIRSILMPILGSRFGSLSIRSFARLLRDALDRVNPKEVAILLVLPGDADARELSDLDRWTSA